MNASFAAMVSAAVCRAVAIALGGVALGAAILGAIAFALVALYSALAPGLGPTAAGLATSGAALVVPALVTLGIVVATRAAIAEHVPAPTPRTAQADAARGFDQALEWINENPRTATLGALSLGVALGAYPELRKTVIEGVDQALASSRGALR